MRHEAAPRPVGDTGTGGQETAGEHVESTIPPTYPRGGDPVRRARLRDRLYRHRRAVLVLDRYLAADKPVATDCGGPHEGPHDWYGSCTGLNLTVAERDAAGTVHPWRLAA